MHKGPHEFLQDSTPFLILEHRLWCVYPKTNSNRRPNANTCDGRMRDVLLPVGQVPDGCAVDMASWHHVSGHVTSKHGYGPADVIYSPPTR